MADVFDTGMAWLAGKMTAHAASVVTYSRAAESSTLEVEVAATRGRTPYEIVGADGVSTSFVAVDFLISPSLLVLDGDEVEPAVGDQITDAQNRVYEVMCPGGTQPHFALVDHDSRFRIHTKLIED